MLILHTRYPHTTITSQKGKTSCCTVCTTYTNCGALSHWKARLQNTPKKKKGDAWKRENTQKPLHTGIHLPFCFIQHKQQNHYHHTFQAAGENQRIWRVSCTGVGKSLLLSLQQEKHFRSSAAVSRTKTMLHSKSPIVCLKKGKGECQAAYSILGLHVPCLQPP